MSLGKDSLIIVFLKLIYVAPWFHETTRRTKGLVKWRVLWNKGILTSVSSGALWVFRAGYSLNCLYVDTGACNSTGPRLHEFHATKNIHSPSVGPQGLIHPTV